jgi:mono/diheme cytochrome c family protein
MSKRPFVIFGIFAALCLVGLPAWALSKEGGESASPETVASQYDDGQELFAINCGACHTLAAAGTDGVVGPNLDTLLGAGAASPETIKGNYDRVLNAVDNGVGGRMPAGVVEGEQAKQVARFVANNVNYVSSAPPPASGG